MKQTGSVLKWFMLVIFACVLCACAYKSPRTHNDLVRYGIELAKDGYWREAGMQWRMVLNEDPGNVAALNNLAVAAEVLEGCEKARGIVEKAHKLRPNDERIEFNRKALHQRMKDQVSRETADESN